MECGLNSMKKILRRKFISSLITIFNISFLLLLINQNHNDVVEKNLLQTTFQAVTMIVTVAIMYVAPIIIFLGVPTSLLIEFLTQKIKFKNSISFILHIIFGVIIMSLLSMIFIELPTWHKLLNVDVYLNYSFLFIYPSIVFWTIDNLLKVKTR